MTRSRDLEHGELIEKILSEVHRRTSDADDSRLDAFVSRYYQRVSPADLETYSPIDLSGAALTHWHLARERRPGTPIVHVYNPHFEKHGWQSTHTIIEIVTDDRPFLVDSMTMTLNRHGLTIHLTIHPVIRVRRDDQGRLIDILAKDDPAEGASGESFMHFEVDRQTESGFLEDLHRDIQSVLRDLSLASEDWQAMRAKTLEAVVQLQAHPETFGDKDAAEAAEFCQWIEADHFTFLGYCEFDKTTGSPLELSAGSELGILRRFDDVSTILPTDRARYSDLHELLVVTKANERSTVHRPAYMDFIGIKRLDDQGRVNGERCIVGLFASAAYHLQTREIPVLRDKVAQIMGRTGLPVSGHAAKALQNIIEVFPRDSLFQISDEELYEIAMGILQLQERQRIRLFVHRDQYRRFYLCLVYLPRERYSREMRLRIQDVLMDAYHGVGAGFDALFSESVLARVQFRIYADPRTEPKYDTGEIESRIREAARSWQDHFREALIDQYGEEQGNHFFHQYSDAFSGAYREDCPARTAVFDIARIDKLRHAGDLNVNFYRPLSESGGGVRLKLFTRGRSVSLSETLPMIENMGLKVLGEQPYHIHVREGPDAWIHEFHLVHERGMEIDPEQLGEKFQDAFVQVWRGNVENDGFNQLVLGAGLTWRETVVLRAYSKYLRQIRIPYSETYLIDTLTDNPRMTQRLGRLFNRRFDPRLQDDQGKDLAALLSEIHQGLDRVSNLDEDRILRGFLEAIQATVRTNFFQPAANGEPKPYLSLKLEPGTIPGIPRPIPMFEIFVYSPRVEAVHLRGGRVARGGLRWSDRREDFRTEVLGLVKAQMVKNAVIVPVGAKGGFVVKRPPGERDALMKEVVHCYKTLICGMLDITDNLDGDIVVPPADVIRHDDDDPYLVVAADKGTATFSDIANGISNDYGFWLGDAFASGGSIGYDHKKMGITARGAWESVKRHFRELGHDTQTQPFSVVGIGDMSGDVFGNGMLLSRQIKLVAAFNHMHVFLDPEPDLDASFAERERLFALPRSNWKDYNAALISEGGGIFKRSAKSIPLSEPVQALLRVKADKLTPNELLNALLKAPVDLIWNGGIGTYVKAADQSDDQVSDRANDAVRVNGAELRCKVFGEGGNLGMTQLGRIEFARNGGRCYTDSIDNSAGVDTSDYEVNIKILLDRIVAGGDLTLKQRNRLLAEMTDEVGALVLRDNYHQTQAISLTGVQAAALFQEQARYLRSLERRDKLDRSLEYLPDNEQIAERAAAGQGLTHPELSILLSYSKLDLFERLLASDVPEDPFLSHELERYFPRRLSERFLGEMNDHRLRREIIATHITNSMVNRAGPSFAFRVAEITGIEPPDIARAYAAARQIFRMRDTWSEVEALDNKVSAEVQLQMLYFASGLIERATLWLLRCNRPPLDVAATVDYFEDGVAALIDALPRPLAAENRLRLKRRTRNLVGNGVPQELAARVSAFIPLSSALDIVQVSHESDQDVAAVATAYFELGGRLHLMWLRDQVADLGIENHWHMLAKSSLRNEFHDQQRRLTAQVFADSDSRKPKAMRPKAMVDTWAGANETTLKRYQQLMTELRGGSTVDFAMLSVALSEVQSLLRH